MDHLLKQFTWDITIRGLSESTQKLYLYKLRLFLNYCTDNDKTMDSESFKDYLYELKEAKNLSLATLKQSIAAVKFFFSTRWIFHMNLDVFLIQRKKKSYQLYLPINKSFHYSNMPQI